MLIAINLAMKNASNPLSRDYKVILQHASNENEITYLNIAETC